MPSPFPGMDPYLEDPSLWPDVHHALATEIRNDLNRHLPPPYYARTEMRPELGIVRDDGDGGPSAPARRIIPDVMVLKHSRRPDPEGGVAVAEPPTRVLSPSIDFASLPDEPARHYFIEIRDTRRGHKLVTLIEILSPANKRPGPDRDSYEAKQREVLSSDVNLVEIDLLRSGGRVLPTPELESAVARIAPPPDYLVFVSRAWMRVEPTWGYRAYPFGVREWLPCVGIPLDPALPEVPLDLQAVFARVYDGGPYRRGAVDYTRRPDPPLAEPDASWALQVLRERGAGR